MTVITLRFSITLLILTILLTACSGQNIEPTVALTATTAPTSTKTPTAYPTLTPTPTITAAPTETANPKPASLTGTIFLSSNGQKPFVTSIELRQKDTFILIGKGKTNSKGVYNIVNIEPGTYELWVLVTSKPLMISGCNDIAPPGNTWQMGIIFGENKALSMENAYLSKALLLSKNISSPDLKAQGFYAVLPVIEIESGIENKSDVILICK